MPARMLTTPITREVEYCGRRRHPTEWSIIANIRPQSAGDRLAFGQHWHCRVIAMDALSGQHVILDQRHQRAECCRAGADPVGQRGDIEINPLAGIHLALAIERLVIAEFGIEDHRQQVRARAATGNRMEWCRWLADCLAGTAHEFLAHGLDHLPQTRDAFQALGNVSPNLANAPPQQGHAVGPGMTIRSRGKCAGRGPRTGLRRVKLLTTLPAWSALTSVAATFSAASASNSSSCSSAWSSSLRPRSEEGA